MTVTCIVITFASSTLQGKLLDYIIPRYAAGSCINGMTQTHTHTPSSCKVESIPVYYNQLYHFITLQSLLVSW